MPIRQDQPLYLRTKLALTIALLSSSAFTFSEEIPVASAGADVEEVYVIGVRENRVSKGATGLTMSIYETPQSVTIMDKDLIDAFALNDVNSALKLMTGINVNETETDRTYYNSRGFDIKSMQVDGIGLPFNWNIVGSLDTAIYEKVEVIRGANGLLTGTGNPSGTINYIRKRPTNEFQASAELSLGQWNMQRAEVDVAGPLNESGTWAGRFVAAIQDAESYLDSYNTGRDTFYGVIDGQLGDNAILTLGYTDQASEANAPLWGALPLLYANGEATDYPTSTSTSMDWAHYNTYSKTGFIEYTHKLPAGWEFKAVLTHNNYEEPSELFYVYGAPDKQTGKGLFGWPGKYFNDSQRTLLDATLSGSFELGGKSHDLLIGVNTSKANSGYLKYDAPTDDPAWGELPALPGWTGTEIARPNFGPAQVAGDWRDDVRRLYAISHLHATDKLDFVVGLNAIDLKTEGFNFGDDMHKDEQKVSPYAGVNYQIASNTKLYASYSDIYEPQIEVDKNLKALGAAIGKSYEFGLKTELFDQRLLATGSVFKAEQENYADFAGFDSVAGVNYYKPIDVVSQGFELEASGRITDKWHLLAGFTQVELENEDGSAARTFVPGKTFNLSTRYTFTQIPALEIGSSIRWQDNIYLGDIKQRAYSVVSGYINYAINSHAKLALNINNLSDEKYLASLYWDQSFYGAPRSLSASLKLSF